MNRPLAAWAEANREYLAKEFATLKAALGGDGAVPEPGGSGSMPAPAAIDILSGTFALTPFERQLLLLCAGVELDGELARLCPQPSFGLALATLPRAHWSALAPVRPLRRWKLIEVAEGASLVSAPLRVDEHVLHYLAGIAYLDPRLKPSLEAVENPQEMAASQAATAGEIAGAAVHRPAPVVQLGGNDRHGKRDVAARASAHCGLELYALPEDNLPESPFELAGLAVLWQRQAALLHSALLIECPGVPAPRLARFVDEIPGLVFVAATARLECVRPDHLWQVDRPGSGDQIALWTSLLNGRSERHRPTLEGVASEFRMSAHEVRRAAGRLDDADGEAGSLWRACRDREHSGLDALAQRITPAAGWDDLVLPGAQKQTLGQIASHVRNRTTVYERWGFEAVSSRGLGITALFAGESGTGKTMAAEVLANELRLDLYRVDLSAVVSKYIGETEKNLARIFDEAEGGGVILLFDEADALFGKRSEVKDSHDRYANIEVSYLLQRMESYGGLAILTTNQRTALDSAFARRLRFVVSFPFPDCGQREEIWRRIFPADTPTVDLAFTKLARLNMAGGHIRNVALNAAFLAADAGEPVSMAHLERAAHGEAAKQERGLTEVETRGWV